MRDLLMWLRRLPGPWHEPYGAKGRPHNPELHALKNRQTAQVLRLHRLQHELARDEHHERQFVEWEDIQ